MVIYAPYNFGDVVLATTVLPDIHEPVTWHLIQRNVQLLEGLPNVTPSTAPPPRDAIGLTPWLNKDLIRIGVRYWDIPQHACFGRVLQPGRRPCLARRPNPILPDLKLPLILVETHSSSMATGFEDIELYRLQRRFPKHEVMVASMRVVHGLRDCGWMHPLDIIDLYEKADIFIGFSAGLSCLTCASDKPPRLRYEISVGGNVSCEAIEPRTIRVRVRTKEELYARL